MDSGKPHLPHLPYLPYLPLLALCALAAPSVAAAQTPPDQSRLDVLVGVEVRRDRFTYHFDNPSSFDTPDLVPHFFEQRYTTDNLWAVVVVDYLAGLHWESSFGATPTRTTTADDYDTFRDPDGTIWVSGTTGDASIHSLRFAQRVDLGHAGPVRVTGGYRLGLDRAAFGVGHKTVTRNGVIVMAFDVTSPEFTSSELHEVFVGAASRLNVIGGWGLTWGAEFSPTAVARLSVRLPEKYPGQDLVFVGKIMAAEARFSLNQRRGRRLIEASIDAGRTWSSHADARLARNSLGVRFLVGYSWAGRAGEAGKAGR